MSDTIQTVALAVIGKIFAHELSCAMLVEAIRNSEGPMLEQFVSELISRPECTPEMLFQIYEMKCGFDDIKNSRSVEGVFAEKISTLKTATIRAFRVRAGNPVIQEVLDRALFVCEDIGQQTWERMAKTIDISFAEMTPVSSIIGRRLEQCTKKTLHRLAHEVECDGMRYLICHERLRRGESFDEVMCENLSDDSVCEIAEQVKETRDSVSMNVLCILYDYLLQPFVAPSQSDVKKYEWIVQEIVRRVISCSPREVPVGDRHFLWLAYAQTLLEEVLIGRRTIKISVIGEILCRTQGYIREKFESFDWKVKIGWSKYLLEHPNVRYHTASQMSPYLAGEYPEVRALYIAKCRKELSFEQMLDRFTDYPMNAFVREAGMNVNEVIDELRKMSTERLLEYWSRNNAYHQMPLKKVIEVVLTERESELRSVTVA